MAKARTRRGDYVFFKERGGAPRRVALSKTARILLERSLVVGRVLDLGCGHGLDADQLGWDAFDPYYRPTPPVGPYDTVIVNHVANILTRGSRDRLFEVVNDLLVSGGIAYFSVARNIPVTGKPGARRRIQNFVRLTLPSIFADDEEEIYRRPKDRPFEDRTLEFERSG